MNPGRGDVLLVRFPFTNGTGAKVRPALVVQNDQDNQRLSNVVVVAITTTTHRSGRATQLSIEAASSIGRQSGLLRDSVVTCENIATLDKGLLLRKIGALAKDAMDQVNQCLKAALAIP